jgi:hypothetical protein
LLFYVASENVRPFLEPIGAKSQQWGVRRDVPGENARDHGPAIEIYFSHRYFAVTCRRWPTSPDCLATLDRDALERLATISGPRSVFSGDHKRDCRINPPQPNRVFAASRDWRASVGRPLRGSLEDVFELQDKVASSVAGVIEPALQAAETARSAGRLTTDLTAYDIYLRASAMFWSSAQVPEALRLLEQAIARDPRYGPALAWAAVCCNRLVEGAAT